MFIICSYLERSPGCEPGELRQTVYKPGSVPRSGERATTIPLGRSLPSASRDRPGRQLENQLACRERSPQHTRRPYLVLLRVGFTLPISLPRSRGALTAPFHPCPPPRRGVGGLFSVALSLGSHPPGVTRHSCFRGARTFLERSCDRPRPSNHLARRDVEVSREEGQEPSGETCSAARVSAA